MAEPVKYTWTVLSQYLHGARGTCEAGVKAATEQEARKLGGLGGHRIISVTTDWLPLTNPPASGPAGQEYQRGDRVSAKCEGRELSGTITAARDVPYEGWKYTLDTGNGKVQVDGDDVYYLHPAEARR